MIALLGLHLQRPRAHHHQRSGRSALAARTRPRLCRASTAPRSASARASASVSLLRSLRRARRRLRHRALDLGRDHRARLSSPACSSRRAPARPSDPHRPAGHPDPCPDAPHHDRTETRSIPHDHHRHPSPPGLLRLRHRHRRLARTRVPARAPRDRARRHRHRERQRRAPPRRRRTPCGILALAGRDDVPVAVGAARCARPALSGAAPRTCTAPTESAMSSCPNPVSRRSMRTPPTSSCVFRTNTGAGSRSSPSGRTTNIALALRLDPTLPSRVVEVTAMGGAALRVGQRHPGRRGEHLERPGGGRGTHRRAVAGRARSARRHGREHARGVGPPAASRLGPARSPAPSARCSTSTSTSTSSSTAAGAARCTIRSLRRSRSAASSPRTRRSSTWWSMRRTAPAAGRRSATCAASASARSTSQAPTCASCSARTARSARTSSIGSPAPAPASPSPSPACRRAPVGTVPGRMVRRSARRAHLPGTDCGGGFTR